MIFLIFSSMIISTARPPGEKIVKAELYSDVNKNGKPFTISLPPPNVTGVLHIGHAFEDTLQDIVIRYHRMRGEKVLWLPGTDHAAIATQAKFEKDLFKSQLIGLFTPNFLDVMMLTFFRQREDKLAKKLIKKAGMYKLNSTFTIANLGLIEIADNLEKFKIKTLLGPMYHSNAMEKYIGILTINNELHFSICFNENNVNQESIHRMKKLISQIFNDNLK